MHSFLDTFPVENVLISSFLFEEHKKVLFVYLANFFSVVNWNYKFMYYAIFTAEEV